MRLKHLLVLCAIQCVIGATTTERVEILTAEYINENVENPTFNAPQEASMETPIKSISDLVFQQTEAIKKIVAEQQAPPKTSADYPSVTKQEADIKINSDSEKKEEFKKDAKDEMEKDSIEELKKKCQQLKRIFNSAAALQPQKLHDATTEKTRTVEAFGPLMQPDFLRIKPKFPSPPPINMPQPPQMAGNYFIFTQNPEMYGSRVNKYSDKMDVAASSVEEDIVSPPSEEVDQVEYEDGEEENLTTPQQSAEQSETEPTPPSIPSTPSTTTEANPTLPKFKYVRLEPIVLKKVILPTGKTSLYWYRLLPATQSFVQIPDTPETENANVVAQPQNYNKDIALPPQYQFYVDPLSGVIKSNTPMKPTADFTTTTTTTERPTPRPQFFINPQTGMIYQSAMPHQFIYHKRVQEFVQPQPSQLPPTTTTTTTTSTTTTTEKIPLPTYTIDIPHAEEKPTEESKKQYKHEFRFVIPMVVTGTQDAVSNYPYQFDPYAYLPKGQRPASMNIPMPYVPNYQMIRTLTIPNKLQDFATKKEA